MSGVHGPNLKDWNDRVFTGWEGKTAQQVMNDVNEMMSLCFGIPGKLRIPVMSPLEFEVVDVINQASRKHLDCIFRTKTRLRLQDPKGFLARRGTIVPCLPPSNP